MSSDISGEERVTGRASRPGGAGWPLLHFLQPFPVQEETLKARPGPLRNRLAGVSLLAIAVSAIAVETLVPLEGTETISGPCVICGPLGGVDFVLNILLLVPIGIAVAMTGGGRKIAVLDGGLSTIAVESLLWRVIAGRDA